MLIQSSNDMILVEAEADCDFRYGYTYGEEGSNCAFYFGPYMQHVHNWRRFVFGACGSMEGTAFFDSYNRLIRLELYVGIVGGGGGSNGEEEEDDSDGEGSKGSGEKELEIQRDARSLRLVWKTERKVAKAAYCVVPDCLYLAFTATENRLAVIHVLNVQAWMPLQDRLGKPALY